MANGILTDRQKIMIGAAVSVLVGLATGALGYVLRDSFDAPRLSLEQIQYEVSREQCGITTNNLYRFRTAPVLRKYIEAAVPWSLARDLSDDKLEYNHVEDLLRLLPDRERYLTAEVPFVSQQANLITQFLSSPADAQGSVNARANIKDAIAYLAGLSPEAKDSDDRLQELYGAFERAPVSFAQDIEGRLHARQRALQTEIDLIAPLRNELAACYGRGTPAPLAMVGGDLTEMPNVQFEVNVLNSGRSDGMISHAIVFKGNSYEINLIGQNPQFLTVTIPTAWARIESNRVIRLAYTIDRVRNQPAHVRQFYLDLTGSGVSGEFRVKDIRGKSLRYRVDNLRPVN